MKTLGSVMPWEEEEDPISRRAADLLGRRRFGEWTDTDQAELDQWLAEATSHYVAYLRLEGIAARADGLAALNAREFKQSAPVGRGGSRYRQFVFPLLAAASLALFATLGILFFSTLMQPSDRTYSTDVGGRTLLKFADGTVVDLDTDTSVRARMTNQERTVWLEKGEAYFHIAHDTAHPFSVIVGRHRVTDIGTEFLVRRGPDRMEVALLTGRASLSSEGAAVAMLAPGDDAVATPVSLSVTRKSPQALADELAWRRGMLVFRDTRLADAVREINRYSTVKLVITDRSIADLRFNGKVKTDDLEDFLNLAQIAMKLRADRQGTNILLSRDIPEKTQRAAHTKRKL